MLDVQRRELKYIVNVVEMTKLKFSLGQIMIRDPHNGLKGYRVRSLYFDTLYDSDFQEKIDGYDVRRKIRLRIYDEDSEIVKLEVKTKKGDSQRKYSLLLSRIESERMIAGDYTFLLERPEKIAQAIYTKMVTCCYRPKCIVEYDREAYIRDVNDIRITFDQNIRATESDFNLFNNKMILYPVAPSGEITMEVKYNRFLISYIKENISTVDKQQIANSKYCRARMITKNRKS